MKLKLISAISLLALGSSYAATPASYTASSNPSEDPDANGDTINVWSTVFTGSAGSFLGNSAGNAGGTSGAGAGNPAWALFANSGDSAFANHTFAGGALTIGQTVSLAFDNGFIDTGGRVGINLLDSSDASLLSFFFLGGESFYQYTDSSGTTNTATGFTGDGGVFSFTLGASNGYSAGFDAFSATDSVFAGTLASSDVAKIQVFNDDAGSGSDFDVYFNDLTVVPEPSTALLGAIGSLLLLRRRR